MAQYSTINAAEAETWHFHRAANTDMVRSAARDGGQRDGGQLRMHRTQFTFHSEDARVHCAEGGCALSNVHSSHTGLHGSGRPLQSGATPQEPAPHVFVS